MDCGTFTGIHLPVFLRVVVLAVLRIIVLVAVLRVIVATLVVVIPFGLIAVSAWNADLRNLYQLENARNAAQDRHGFALRFGFATRHHPYYRRRSPRDAARKTNLCLIRAAGAWPRVLSGSTP